VQPVARAEKPKKILKTIACGVSKNLLRKTITLEYEHYLLMTKIRGAESLVTISSGALSAEKYVQRNIFNSGTAAGFASAHVSVDQFSALIIAI